MEGAGLRRSRRLIGGEPIEIPKSTREIEDGIKSIKTVTWDPFSVFPKEIYLEIFNKLDNPVDKRNFMNAHRNWYDLFKSQRVVFLFQEVFEEIGIPEIVETDEDGYELYYDYWYSDMDSLEQQQDEERQEGQEQLSKALEVSLTPKESLLCRLICREWNIAVQNYMQLHSSYLKVDDGDRIFPQIRNRTFINRGRFEIKLINHERFKRFCWLSSEEVRTALEKYSVTHPPSKNPFLSRNICLLPFSSGGYGLEEHNLEGEDLERYRASIDTLLEKYGRHVWHCLVEFTKVPAMETCLRLIEWLKLMPELKSLEVHYVDIRGVPRSSYSLLELRQLQQVQLPQLELRKLVYLNLQGLPPAAFNIFGQLNELPKLKIDNILWKIFHLKDYEISRENLKEAFFTINGMEDLEYLLAAEMFPNVKKLVMALKVFEKWPEWGMIWNVLEAKFPALEDLTLMLPKPPFSSEEEAIKQSLEGRLDLKNLKKVWVALPNLCAIDFLRECKLLEEINIVLMHCEWNSWKVRGLERKEKVNFNINFNKMGESNIWEEFPQLKKLEIRAKRVCESFDLYRYEKEGEGIKCYKRVPKQE